MKTKSITALTVLILLASCAAPELLAQKTKDKEKGFTQKAKSKEKRYEPVVKENLQDYLGTYVGIEPAYVIEIRLGQDGKLKVNSLEDNRKVAIENLQLEGSHMTATKVY